MKKKNYEKFVEDGMNLKKMQRLLIVGKRRKNKR